MDSLRVGNVLGYIASKIDGEKIKVTFELRNGMGGVAFPIKVEDDEVFVALVDGEGNVLGGIEEED